MIDLDQIKASGQNSAEHSAELLALHQWRERVRVHGELCASFLRDKCPVSSVEFAAFCELAEVGL